MKEHVVSYFKAMGDIVLSPYLLLYGYYTVLSALLVMQIYISIILRKVGFLHYIIYHPNKLN